MAILNAPTTTPSVSLSMRSDVKCTTYNRHHPSLPLQFRRLLGLAFLLLSNICLAAGVVGHAFWVGVLKFLLASKTFAMASYGLTKQLCWTVWDSRRSRRVRKRIEFEFFALVLGPSGNILLQLLFWPGWLAPALVLGWLWVQSR
ncbi:hypothetical protein B0T26DRAFT_305152 [Lasiosphaeria miniovina]|uniref:Uncharacterized protein n=1 Tax=Lasiosphaeria miniovina TaxID=1954250 RepID=A0AA40ALB2_9PEZI|nr:uncharacterized protein B0T26DRAFT_305152 [Lasiosphaeria miniovina]KAK0717870.1 hypothetical protein B0T26DRAFT_305152 [Lasiosphaeria miniovina]